MRHFLLSGVVEVGQRRILRGADFHYLFRVRRHRIGDELDAVGDDGTNARVRILSVSDDSASIEIVASGLADTSRVPITVYQAVPKGRRFEDATRLLVQAGVTTIVPLYTERTIPQSRDQSSARRERLRRIVREAVQQSGNPPIEVATALPLAEAAANVPGNDPHDLALFLHTQTLATTSLHDYLDAAIRHLSLFVGPEGGFADGECALLTDHGVRPLWLGPQVYRSEAAGLAAVSAARLLLLERLSWQLTK